MHNSKKSSHVKTGFIPNVYSSSEMLSSDPHSQEKIVELVIIHNSPT